MTVIATMPGPTEHTRLLSTASGGDPLLLRALTVIGARAGGLSGAQLGALRALTATWGGPDGPLSLRQPSTLDSSGPDRHAARADSTDSAGGTDTPDDADRIELTDRQREVLALLGDGLTIQAIARRLCLSPRTVGKHLERMYRRFGTSDRLTTVLRAQRSGLLAPAGHLPDLSRHEAAGTGI